MRLRFSEGGRASVVVACGRWRITQKGGAGCSVFLTMAVHTPVQKEFIVRRLAAFETARAITIAFQANFPDTKCSEQDVIAADPRVSVVSPELYAIFKAESASFLEQNPLFADQRARLHVMSKQVEDALSRGDQAAVRTIFRQIAEETGVVAGKGGKLAPAASTPVEPIEEIRVTYIDPKVPATAAAS